MFATTGQTYNGTQAMEQILKPALKYGNLEDYYYKVKTGLKVKEQIFFLRRPKKITIKGQGCKPASNNTNFERSQKYWNPTPVEARLDVCWTEFYGQLEEAALAGGTDVANLEKSKQMKVMLDMLVPTAYEDLLRMVWLSKKTITPAELTNGAADVKNYNQVDGFQKLIEDGVAASKIKYVPNEFNSESTADAQLALSTGYSKTLFRKLVGSQSALMKQAKKADKVLYVTSSLYENWEDDLEANDKLESARVMLLDGVDTLRYRGIPLVVLDVVDTYIEADFLVAGKYNKPHRAYLCVKDNLQIAVDTDTSNPIGFKHWYENKDRMVYFDLMYKLDVQIADEDFIVASY